MASVAKNADRAASRDARSGCCLKSPQIIFGKRCLSLHESPQYASLCKVSTSESFFADSLGLFILSWDDSTVSDKAMSLS